MDSPGSSTCSPPDLTVIPKISPKKCQICENPAHGKHFGAITCRACAAFFRRFGISKKFKPCKLENKCTFRKNGYFSCKKCRMQRCLQFGMTIDNFQFDREPIYRKDLEIPQVIEMFSAICLNSFSDSWHIFWKAQLNTFQCSIGLQQLQTLSWCSISCR